MNDNRTYRIRTDVKAGDSSALHVNINQTYDTFRILSVELTQSNAYKLYQSDYGVLVGRVYANGGFGVPNAKVSIFIEAENTSDSHMYKLYSYWNPSSKGPDGVRYNLLPDYVDDACHQTVGTFPNKRFVLDNDDIIEVFDKYYKYTTSTNAAGDYMIFGIPKGGQQLHIDVDLSDIGILSQRPRDMIYKGYDVNQFESPNKFKKDKNLASLVQIMTHDAGVYIYPFWGDTSDDGEDIAITRYDFELPYKFEPTCVFMGSAMTTTGGAAIGKNCTPTESLGRMADMVTGEGNIEMIRKTYDGRIEEYSIKGNRNIDGDGVWCYQIPMNLDYMVTDEFGNMVPTDNPENGIPTRASVRFRISLDDVQTDTTARKRCRYLVPNNPRDTEDYPDYNVTHEVDYEFGTATKDENFRDLFWNNVYTVKNYIPRIQKNKKVNDRRHTGIKFVNHNGQNNAMPYNNMNIKLTFSYRMLCIMFKIFVNLLQFINTLITIMMIPICDIAAAFEAIGRGLKSTWILKRMAKPFFSLANLFYSMVPTCISLSSEFCGDNVTHAYTFYPGCESRGCVWDKTKREHEKDERNLPPEERTEPTRSKDELYNCIETALAEEYDVNSLNFENDWINGVLYLPMWFRYIVKKRSYLFGLIRRRAKDQWCSSERYVRGLPKLFQTCALRRNGSVQYTKHDGKKATAGYVAANSGCKGKKKTECHKTTEAELIDYGWIVRKETMLGEYVYYYKPVEYSDGQVKILYATDLVLLGSLNECDRLGIPQLFKSLESSTYIIPNNVLSADNEVSYTMSKDGTMLPVYDSTSISEMSGMDWGNSNGDLCNKKDQYEEKADGGLFYSIGCSSLRTLPKSCVNLSRVCELGVFLDNAMEVFNRSNGSYERIPPDGFISFDEAYGQEMRSMFATMNGNNLRTKLDEKTGFPIYDFRYLRAESFDNSLYYEMMSRQTGCKDKNMKNNYKLETFSPGYYDFRMGLPNHFYMGEEGEDRKSFPRYENSFYFYFGLKDGKTAINKFNSQYYAECKDAEELGEQYTVLSSPNSWCSDGWVMGDGYLAMDLSKMDAPLKVSINGNGVNIILTVDEEKSKFYVSQESVEELDGKGYTHVHFENAEIVSQDDILGYDTNDDNRIGDGDRPIASIKNGRYVMTIEDANGNETRTVLILEPEQVKYDLVVSDFEDDDDLMVAEYLAGGRTEGEAREDIANDSADVDAATTSDTRKIGGTICVKNIHDNDDDMVGSFSITVTNADEETSGIVGYAKAEGGIFTDVSDNCIKSEFVQDADMNIIGNKVIFGVPKADIDYTVTIRRLCEDDGTYYESDDVLMETCTVHKPRPMKLYINESIDYDTIKDWNVSDSMIGGGSQHAGLVSQTSNVPLGGGDVFQWSRLSKADYNWDKLDDYNAVMDIVGIYDETLYNIYGDKMYGLSGYEDYKISDKDKVRKALEDGDLWSEIENIITHEEQPSSSHSAFGDGHAHNLDYVRIGINNHDIFHCDHDYTPSEEGGTTPAPVPQDYDRETVIMMCNLYHDPSEDMFLLPYTEEGSNVTYFYFVNKGEPKPEENSEDPDTPETPDVEEGTGEGDSVGVETPEFVEVGDKIYPVADECDLRDYLYGTEARIETIISTLYSMVGKDENGENEYIENSLQYRLDTVKSEYIDEMKRTFWKTCEGEEKTLSFRLDTTNVGTVTENNVTTEYPYYKTAYNNEITPEDDYAQDNLLEAFTVVNDRSVRNIDGVTIPTLTYQGSPYYGTDNVAYGNLYNTQVNGITKYSYMVYGINRRMKTLPISDKYFAFPIVDKMFTVEYNMWAPVVNMPSFSSATGNISMLGLFAGDVINGMPLDVDVASNKITSTTGVTLFENVAYGYLIPKILTKYGSGEDEDTMPVRRLINGGDLNMDGIIKILGGIGLRLKKYLYVVEPEENSKHLLYLATLPTEETGTDVLHGRDTDYYSPSEHKLYIKAVDENKIYSYYAIEESDISPLYMAYPGYKRTYKGTQYTDDGAYMPVFPLDETFDMEDRFGCTVSESIDGSMNVIVEDDTVNDTKSRNNTKLVVGIEGLSDENVATRYYLYRLTQNSLSQYPLDSSKIVEVVAGTGVYKFSGSLPALYDYTMSLSGYSSHSDTGEFTGSQIGDSLCYVVAEAGSHNKLRRCISPVYDFRSTSNVYGLFFSYFCCELVSEEEDSDAYTYKVKELRAFGLCCKTDNEYLTRGEYMVSYEMEIYDGGQIYGSVVLNETAHPAGTIYCKPTGTSNFELRTRQDMEVTNPPTGFFPMAIIPLNEENSNAANKVARAARAFEGGTFELSDVTGVITLAAGGYAGDRDDLPKEVEELKGKSYNLMEVEIVIEEGGNPNATIDGYKAGETIRKQVYYGTEFKSDFPFQVKKGESFHFNTNWRDHFPNTATYGDQTANFVDDGSTTTVYINTETTNEVAGVTTKIYDGANKKITVRSPMRYVIKFDNENP